MISLNVVTDQMEKFFFNFFTQKRTIWFVFLSIGISAFCCSTPSIAIVNGQENSGPAKFSLMVLDDHGEMCSGVVLSQQIILTAAHCVANATDWRIHWRDEDGSPVLIKPESVLVHPAYDRNAVAKRHKSIDLALIKLPDPLPSRFQPIIVSSMENLEIGDHVTVAGFGFSEEKNRKTLGIMRSTDLNVVQPYGKSNSIIWLEDGIAHRAGACQGDSGGPILYQGELFAITSWSSGEGKSNCGAYTQGIILSQVKDWISNSFVKLKN